MSRRYPNFGFEILKQSHKSRARRGRILTPHGIVETPAFIFCATKATVKGVPIRDVKEAGTQIILSNTYHLMLQPGADLVEKMGGLHKFCGWDGPMLTDSGGFQIFSLGHGSVAEEIKGRRVSNRPLSQVKITEEGARFKSYLDGKQYLLTPERSIEIQRKLGPDLVVVLDECTPFHVDKNYTRKSMEMSHRWALRSLAEFDRGNDGKQALYGIIQGGVYEDLRTQSVDFVNSHDFFGHAVGGSLGADKNQMYEIVEYTTHRLDPSRPIHLLGIGGIRDIFIGARNGIDTFDCVHPTRLARHGGALVKGHTKEHLNLRNAMFQEDPRPLEEGCGCITCQQYSRSYVHHLLKARELLAFHLITVHNIYFMNQLMLAVRQAIEEDRLEEEARKWISS
jgi:queuine tRNA-ribosyltransferase